MYVIAVRCTREYYTKSLRYIFTGMDPRGNVAIHGKFGACADGVYLALFFFPPVQRKRGPGNEAKSVLLCMTLYGFLLLDVINFPSCFLVCGSYVYT